MENKPIPIWVVELCEMCAVALGRVQDVHAFDVLCHRVRITLDEIAVSAGPQPPGMLRPYLEVDMILTELVILGDHVAHFGHFGLFVFTSRS